MICGVSILFFRCNPVLIREYPKLTFLPKLGYDLEYTDHEHTWQGVRILITTPHETCCITRTTHAAEYAALAGELEQRWVELYDDYEEWETAEELDDDEEEWEVEEELELEADAEFGSGVKLAIDSDA